MDYISVQEAAQKWGISERRIQKLCEEDRIPGVIRFSRIWLIPKDAKKPEDGRRKENKKVLDCPLGGGLTMNAEVIQCLYTKSAKHVG